MAAALRWTAEGAGPGLALERVADGLTLPVCLAVAPGDANRLYIVEQRVNGMGRVRIVEQGGGGLLPDPFLEISGVSESYEQGLLGLAFHPKYLDNGYLYIYFTAPDPLVNPVPPHCASKLARFRVSDADRDRADPASREVIMSFPQPSTEHNGGWLAFGSDGYLYLSTGDGGPAIEPSLSSQAMEDDPAPSDRDESQMGRILRIDVDMDAFPDDPNRNYAIPSDNPFAYTGAPETWVYGLRNPWRASLDRETGDLWIGDIGNLSREEIDFRRRFEASGSNFGWPFFEGTLSVETFSQTKGDAEFVSPILDYGREVGACVTCGYVYRGKSMPWLHGAFFYSDFAMGWVRSFRMDGERRIDERDWTTMLNESLRADGGKVANIASFGEDAEGELYLVSLGGSVYKLVAAK